MNHLPLAAATESTPLVLPMPCGCRHSMTLGPRKPSGERDWTVRLEQCPLHFHAVELRDALQAMIAVQNTAATPQEKWDARQKAVALIAKTSKPQ